MSPYWTFAILFILALLQSTVVPHIKVLGVHPEIVLMVVTSWSLLRGSEEGMLWALIGGTAMDLFSGARFGVCTLSLLIVSVLSGLGRRRIFRLELLIPVLVAPLATLIYEGMVLALLKLLGWPANWGESLRRIVIPCTLINTLGMPVVYLLMRTLHRRTGQREMAW